MVRISKKTKHAAAWTAVILILLVVVIVKQYLDIGRLGENLANLRKEHEELQADYSGLESEHSALESEYAAVEEEKETVEKEKSELMQNYSQLKKEVNTTIKIITKFEKDLRWSMSWFKDNSNLDSVEMGKLKENLADHCLRVSSVDCTIKLSCLPWVNWYFFDIDYRSDDVACSGECLLDLKTTINNSGGDCEDLAVLFAAEYNYLVGECLSAGIGRPKIELMSFAAGDAKHYVTYWDSYYLPGSTDKPLPEGYSYIYPVCGLFSGVEGGHCAVVATNKPIGESGDIDETVREGYFIESENGEFMYTAKNRWDRTYLYYIFLENDLKQYMREEDEPFWLGYNELYNKLKHLKDSLKKVK